MSITTSSSPPQIRNIKFEDFWPEMRSTILCLLRQEPVKNAEWQNLFWIVYEVCMWDELGADKLLDALKEDILDFIRHVKMEVMSNKEDQALLKAYILAWRKFFNQCFYLSKPFVQVEKSLKKHKSDDQSLIVTLMHESWSSHIFSYINVRLLNSAMKLVLAERNGESFDSQLVIGVRESYVNLCSNDKQIYKDNFEAAYLTETENFYLTKASEFLAQNGVQQYMVWADQKLREEEQRAKKYLESSSFQALSDICVKVLVNSIKYTILAECPSMIRNNEISKLNLMFRLIDRSQNGVSQMLTDLETFIVNQGLADMMSCADTITQDSEKYIEQLLDQFRRFSLFVKDAFNDDPRFLTARDKAFKKVVNDTSVFKLELQTKPKNAFSNSVNKMQPESRCPELLANYCDMLLRKTPLSRKLTSDEIEAKLKEVLLLLKYVQNKDVFMRYHKAHLTRRLILDTSADNEKEENMVEWLRELGMPADTVNKLSRMFQDIKVSEDLSMLFKSEKAKSHTQSEDAASTIDTQNASSNIPESINIKILNAGAWARGAERIQVSLPLDLEEIIPEIEEFYRKKHSGRKLQWHHHMSNGTIAFANNVGIFDLDVTTFQMVVLFCWNNRPHEKISFEMVRLATELPDIELRRTLWSLVCFPKLKRQVLLCCSDVKSPKDFENSTMFYINQDFTIVKNGKPQKRGKLNLIGRLQLSTEKSKEEDNESIIQLRILRTQEAIVKIMKIRQKMSGAQLQTELVEMLKNFFLPSRRMIKEQIEWLIENKFIKRDEDDIASFVYVA